MGYTKHAFSGVSYQTINKLATAVLTFAKIYILARLLDPSAFGLFSITAIALGLTESFTQTGVNLTIMQSKRSTEFFLDTAWVISIIRGLIIGVIMLLLSFWMANFFHEPQLLGLIALAALVPIIRGFINPYIVNLQRQFQFFADNVYRIVLLTVEILLAVGLCYYLHSVWALVIAVIGSAVFEVALSFLLLQKKPVFRYYPSRAKEIFSNGRSLNLATILSYLNDNADNFTLGRLVGVYDLGIYQNSFALSHKLNYEVAKSVNYATLPIYQHFANDYSRLRRAFLRSLLVTGGIVLVLSAPLLMFPELAISILLGQKWLATIPLIRPLVLAGLVQSLSMATYTLLLTKKDYALMNWHMGTTLILMIGLIIFFSSTGGVVGATYGVLLARSLTVPIIIYALYKHLKKSH